ncbi:multicopper oxidase [Microthyrium microscopicum]|uniref:Multicopper oxidase n=1 Tax=Microthyrium microscopicum TaxID=703497 RepID=A0A6A6UQF8_9PEZI|nr:multicopper oxidase [Microthyrium microscopicum]
MLIATLFPLTVLASTVTYDLEASWMRASPDGFERSVIGINGEWPLPTLYATKGDTVTVTLKNSLGNVSTSLHWHGIFQNGTTNMDGSVGASQCSIPPGSSLTYNFTLNQSGTYWYHSHLKGQYPDGMRAPFIIADPDMPFKNDYDEELVISLSDWYHDFTMDLAKSFLSVGNPTGAEPVPDSALMNETQNLNVKVAPGKTYLIRLVNLGAFANQRFWIEGHQMKVVEVDGVWTEPKDASIIYLAVAQRCSVLVSTTNSTGANFPMVTSMDTDLFDAIPDGLQWNTTGWLVYDDSKPKPAPKVLDTFDDFDDFTLVPQDRLPRFPEPDHTITLDLYMDNLGDGANYAFFSGQTYVSPKVPTIYSVMTLGEDAANVSVYGDNTNAYILEKGQVIEVIINNQDPGKHPVHLHGHNFQVVAREAADTGDAPANLTDAGTPGLPMRRDTITLWPTSYARVRFIADNPGVWLFHCHIEWHTISGLIATFIEAPLEVQKSLKIPDDHLAVCKAEGVPTAGNAAGNTVNHFDLTGENKSPAPLPAGFTARGIVALVFSCIAAFLGCAVIAWYGYAPLKQ